MRTPVGVALLIVCLGLTGCSLFGKKQAARNNNNTTSNPKPFLGTEGAAKEEPAAVPASSGGPLPRANGLVAGQVVAISTGRPVRGARIQVVDLEEDDSKNATLEAETLEGGYFTIAGLKVGRHYKLIARAEQGGDLVSKVVFVEPPKPNLYLQLSKANTSSTTPPVPDPPKLPGKKDVSGTESSHERTPSATTLDPPVKVDPGKGSAPFRQGESSPPPDNGMGASGGNSGNISNIAQEFPRTPAPRPQTADVTIPNPNKTESPDGPQSYRSAPWPQPPAPQWERVPDERRPGSTTPAAPGPRESVHLPSLPTRIPSCALFGKTLNNFALYDVNGQSWEYKKDFHGRLLLVDFWYHTCSPCLQAIPRLNALQREYGPYGLQVVGIACETGTLEEQRSHVRNIRGRYNINYTTLLSGGGPEPCPVIKQFQVTYYPMLVLIDKSGKIIWRSTDKGMDDFAHEKLRRMIHQQLIQN